MSDEYDWRDLSCTAVAEPGPAHVTWTVYEQGAWSSDEPDAVPYYTRAGQPRADDFVESLAEAEVWIVSTIKWDGCSELEFPNGMHVCGWPAAQNLHAVHTRLFEMTAWYLGERADPHELSTARYTPTHLPIVDGSVADRPDMIEG